MPAAYAHTQTLLEETVVYQNEAAIPSYLIVYRLP